MGESQRQTSSSTLTPTYNDPRAQGGLDVLSNLATGRDPVASDLSNFYRKQLSGTGANPHLENLISTGNALSDKLFRDRLAQIKSSGYGGGLGRSIINQGQFISDFTAQQAAENARLRYGDFERGQERAFEGAAGLGGLLDRNTGAAATLLNALRGQKGEQIGKARTSGISGGDLLMGAAALASAFV